MENKISFVEFIKNEILEFNWEESQLDILFYYFLLVNSTIKNDKEFKVGISLKSKEDYIVSLFKKFYNVEPKVLHKETKINFVIDSEEFVKEFYEKGETILNINLDRTNSSSIDVPDYEDELANVVSPLIAGAFLGRGWISKPSSRFYHLEFRISDINVAINLKHAIDSLSTGNECKLATKTKWYIVYVKKSMVLADLLKAMNANEAMMIFEDERINRDFTASFSKMQSIEVFNQKKIKATSDIQIKAIEKLKGSVVWNTLNDNKVKIAELRLRYPEYSLSDLQYTYNSLNDTNVSKSTVNIWLKEIVEKSKLV